MDIPTIHPPAVRPGDTIGIIAPAGPLEDRGTFDRGVAVLEGLGFHIRYDQRIFRSLRYLAGTDEERAEELMRSFEEPDIDAILSLRGGYGCSRLIPLLNEKRLRPNCKVFMGFSDLTTLHLYFRRRYGWVTFHGPMASSPTLPGHGSPEANHLMSLLGDPNYLPSFSLPTMEGWFPGVAEGRLTGGCLSVIAASIGTPYEIKTEGRVLFLEDLGEHPYRIDRMITQLRQGGKLDSVAGLLLGSFTDCEPNQAGYTLKESLKEILAVLNVPVLAGFPAGHGPENWAIPLGVHVRLDADSPSLEFLESAVSARQNHT